MAMLVITRGYILVFLSKDSGKYGIFRNQEMMFVSFPLFFTITVHVLPTKNRSLLRPQFVEPQGAQTAKQRRRTSGQGLDPLHD